MANSSTAIQIGENSFDLAGVGDWVGSNVWICLLFALVVFVFYIFRKGGFAEKLLEYRLKGRELDAKQLDDARVLADTLRKRYERDEPYLPFDSKGGSQS